MFPLYGGARLAFLQAICAVAENGTLQDATDLSARVVAAAIGDVHMFSVLNGREGEPRSLDSLRATTVLKFLSRGISNAPGRWARPRREMRLPIVPDRHASAAITHDGSSLLLTHGDSIVVLSLADGALERTIGNKGVGPMQFCVPIQVCVSPRGSIFVADTGNDRVQFLTPRYEFGGFIGDGRLKWPKAVCANDEIVVVTEDVSDIIQVFRQSDGAYLRSIDSNRRVNGFRSIFVCNGVGLTISSNDSKSSYITSVDAEGNVTRKVDLGWWFVWMYDMSSSPFGEVVGMEYLYRALFLVNTAGVCGPPIVLEESPFAIVVRGSSVFVVCDRGLREYQ